MQPTRIYVVGRAWSPRVWIRAQLLEEGFDVTALETVDELRREIKRRLKGPDLIIVDCSDAPLDPEALAPLQELNERAPVLICVAGPDRARARSAGLPFLARPFSVRDVVNRARALLKSGRSSERRADDSVKKARG